MLPALPVRIAVIVEILPRSGRQDGDKLVLQALASQYELCSLRCVEFEECSGASCNGAQIVQLCGGADLSASTRCSDKTGRARSAAKMGERREGACDV
jgi:hypothetical protein